MSWPDSTRQVLGVQREQRSSDNTRQPEYPHKPKQAVPRKHRNQSRLADQARVAFGFAPSLEPECRANDYGLPRTINQRGKKVDRSYRKTPLLRMFVQNGLCKQLLSGRRKGDDTQLRDCAASQIRVVTAVSGASEMATRTRRWRGEGEAVWYWFAPIADYRPALGSAVD